MSKRTPPAPTSASGYLYRVLADSLRPLPVSQPGNGGLEREREVTVWELADLQQGNPASNVGDGREHGTTQPSANDHVSTPTDGAAAPESRSVRISNTHQFNEAQTSSTAPDNHTAGSPGNGQLADTATTENSAGPRPDSVPMQRVSAPQSAAEPASRTPHPTSAAEVASAHSTQSSHPLLHAHKATTLEGQTGLTQTALPSRPSHGESTEVSRSTAGHSAIPKTEQAKTSANSQQEPAVLATAPKRTPYQLGNAGRASRSKAPHSYQPSLHIGEVRIRVLDAEQVALTGADGSRAERKRRGRADGMANSGSTGDTTVATAESRTFLRTL